MYPVHIEAFDIPSAWFQVVEACMKHGYNRPVFRGERKEQRRKEIDFLQLRITNPSTRPLVPDVPTGVPPVSSDEDINKYLAYIATPEKTPEQTYTYGERTMKKYVTDINDEASEYLKEIEEDVRRGLTDEAMKAMEAHDKREGQNIHKEFNQFDTIMQFMKETPETNRSVVEVGMAQDLMIDHPPCLRYLQFKIRYDKLHMFGVFRSWDAMYGLPMNLGAYQKLKESMVYELNEHYAKEGKPIIEDGEIFASSFGAHVYSGQWEYANMVINRPSASLRMNVEKKV
jgi:thymidylate synthase